MTYGPIIRKTGFQGAKSILASEHLQYSEGGATLDHTKFPTGVNEVGAIIARNTTSGKFEPFSAIEGFDNFAVLNEEFNNDYEQDLIAGEVIVRDSGYEAKLPQEVPTEFNEANRLIGYVIQI